jgi:uncharacterized protein (TIRG00374 family)
MNNKQKNIIKLIFGISLLFFVFYKIGLREIYKTILKINIFFVIPFIIIFYMLFFILGTINLKVLLDPIKKVPFKKLLKYYALSWSFGLFIPAKIGEFSLIFLLKKEKIPIGKTTAISVIDKTITLITFAIFSAIGFLIFFNKADSLKFTLVLLIILAVAIFSVLSNRTRNIIKKLIGKYHIYFKGFSKTLFSYLKKNKKVLLINFILTLIKWGLIDAGLVFIYFLAFGKVINPIYIILITAITLIVGLIPITINGIGVKTPTAVFLYSQLGIVSSIVASVYLIDLIIKYLIASFILAFLFDKKSLKFK